MRRNTQRREAKGENASHTKHQGEQKQENEQQCVAGSAAFRCILAEILLDARHFSVLVIRSLALVSRILLHLPSLLFFCTFFSSDTGLVCANGKEGVLLWASAKGSPPVAFSASSHAPLHLTRARARESVCVVDWCPSPKLLLPSFSTVSSSPLGVRRGLGSFFARRLMVFLAASATVV